MDFDLSEELQALQRMCRDFGEQEIRPYASEWSESATFPTIVFQHLGELGLMGMLVPEAYGGSNAGMVAYVAVMEELGAADQAVAAAWNAHSTIGTLPLLEWGSERQKKEWLVPLATG